MRIDPETGEEKSYPSMKATEADGFREGSVRAALDKKNCTAGGYYWRRAEDAEEAAGW